ncbi:MAG: tRNA epoxyqueuosine(34) reductase QueG [Pirellulales bacterium]
MSPNELTAKLKRKAFELGFSASGACRAVTPEGISRFGEWLEAGYAGQMHYLPDRREAYENPQFVLDGARSILMLVMNYRTVVPAEPGPGRARISRYAWGGDYHDLIRGRLNELADDLQSLIPEAEVRGVVDTAPLLEREFAQLAGLGWIGKNTLLLNCDAGSWFFLAALLTDQELVYDEPTATDHCGTCTACLDACPTDAFVDAYVLDARRCISYLTIELKEMIPAPLREGVGDWLFGCDVCQHVCPWNHFAPPSGEPALMPRENANPVALAPLFDMDDEQFRRHFRGTPLWRPRRRGILRNAAIVLGNQRHPSAIPALAKGLNDSEPLVRAASAWALGRYDQPPARDELVQRSGVETDVEVIAEIDAALHA